MSGKRGIQLNTPVRRMEDVWRGIAAAVLFACLALCLCDVLAMPVMVLPLALGLLSAASSSLFGFRGKAWVLTVLAAAACLIIMVTAGARGAMIVCQRLFSASEAVNHYRYVRLDAAPDEAGELIFRCTLAVFGGMACGAAAKWVLCDLILALAAAAFEVFFGVVPMNGLNAALFGLMGALFIGKRRAPLVAYSAMFVAVCLAVFALFPQVDGRLEDYSEYLRDRFSDALMEGDYQSPMPDDEIDLTRRENRLAGEARGDDGEDERSYRDYEKITRYRDEVSEPNRLDIKKIVLMLALVILLLVGPFAPFYFWDARRKKAVAERTVFESDNINDAICALFDRMVRVFTAVGAADGNDSYSDLPPKIEKTFSAELASRFEAILPAWYRAAYSDRSPDEEDRAEAIRLFRDVEKAAWEKMDRKMRLRSRYVDFLIMPEDEQ